MSAVVLKACKTYDQAAVDAAVEAVLTQGGFSADPKGGTARVVLKVNLLMKAGPEEAVTTHPAVVRAAVRALKRRGFQTIVIADSPSGPFVGRRLDAIYRASGLAAVAQEEGAILNDDLSCDDVVSPTGRTIPMLRVVRDADVVIGMAKLKTHAMVGYTGGVKNYFGVIPGLIKSEKHLEYSGTDRFCDMLCDVCDTVAPTFTLMDGIVGMEGDGPSGGTPRAVGVVAGSADPYHLDRALLGVIGFSPDEARTVARSIARGQAPAQLDALDLVGDTELLRNPIQNYRRAGTRKTDFSGSVPAFVRPVWERLVTSVSPRPVVRQADCIGCGRCVEICPKKTIQMENGRARVLKRGCIRCFCCHEVCPARAIDIKSNRLFEVLT